MSAQCGHSAQLLDYFAEIKIMPWIQLKINSKQESAEQIGSLLSDNGAEAVTFMDGKDDPIYEPTSNTVQYWPTTEVIGLYDAEFDMAAVIANLRRTELLADDFSYRLEQLPDKDWEREWMDNFHPMQFGEKLWICPTWCDVPEPAAVNIMLDPGLAFGTGTHPTTALCLQWLDSADVAGKTVIDYGCGSGILAIAALLLGAQSAIGIDIDPQALIASKANAERNGVAERLSLYLAAQQPECTADIVMANILAEPLMELRTVISRCCKDGGSLVMSGILDTQAERVTAAYTPEFSLDPPVLENEWARVAGRKHRPA